MPRRCTGCRRPGRRSASPDGTYCRRRRRRSCRHSRRCTEPCCWSRRNRRSPYCTPCRCTGCCRDRRSPRRPRTDPTGTRPDSCRRCRRCRCSCRRWCALAGTRVRVAEVVGARVVVVADGGSAAHALPALQRSGRAGIVVAARVGVVVRVHAGTARRVAAVVGARVVVVADGGRAGLAFPPAQTSPLVHAFPSLQVAALFV